MTKLAWIDLETTGLNPDTCHVLEVAAIVTDGAFVELGRFSALVAPPPGALDNLDAAVRDMHTANGLLAQLSAGHGSALPFVDDALADWLFAVAAWDGPPQLAGSTINFDRAFLARHMPKTLARLHYHNLDVSSFNEMARRHWPAVYEARPRDGDKRHRAMADIEQSIAVARHYASALAPVEVKAA